MRSDASLPSSRRQAAGISFGLFLFQCRGRTLRAMQGRGHHHNRDAVYADITIECEECHGLRYKRNVLDIRYRGKIYPMCST